MSSDRSRHSIAAGAGGVLVTVILVNVIRRLVPLPDIDLPVSFPDLPAWIDPAVDVARTALKVKTWLLAGVVVVLVVATWLDRRGPGTFNR